MVALLSGVTVGIIANPAAGKDIRRLVAHGRVVSNQEKANILRRVFAGLVSMGVERVLVMPDTSGLARPAIEDSRSLLNAEFVDMHAAESQRHSTRAARLMREQGAGCIVTLGGDGTNRVVAKGAGELPIVPISTGTNNVFPQMTEGTLAGMAAGAIASGMVRWQDVCRRSKRLDVYVDGERHDDALVDAAVSTHQFVGARAIWEPDTLDCLFLTRAEPASIGLSSLGSRLKPTKLDDPHGLYLRFKGEPGPNATTARAPLAPGLVRDVEIADWSEILPGEKHPVSLRRGTIALDGEREVELIPSQSVEVSLAMDGPYVVDIVKTHELLAQQSARDR